MTEEQIIEIAARASYDSDPWMVVKGSAVGKQTYIIRSWTEISEEGREYYRKQGRAVLEALAAKGIKPMERESTIDWGAALPCPGAKE